MTTIEFAAEEMERCGALRICKVLDEAVLAELVPLFGRVGSDRPGARIPVADIRTVAAVDRAQRLAWHIDPRMKPVRAVLFDKCAKRNWTVAWHQDRTIAVAARHDIAGFGPWTIKDRRVHVAPPVSLLADMLTMRLHVDAVDSDNAPLLVAPGSHRFGLVPETELADAVGRSGTLTCLADAGDIWIYRTLALHASQRAVEPRRRRVLQIDWSASDLPRPLAWAN